MGSILVDVGLGVAAGGIVLGPIIWYRKTHRPRSDNALWRSQIETELRAIDGLAQLQNAFWQAMRAIDRMERDRRP